MPAPGLDEGCGRAADAGGVIVDESPARAVIRLGHPGQIAQGMTLCLAWEAQTASGVEGQERRPIDPRHPGESGAQGGGAFALEMARVVVRRREEVAVDASKIASDVLPGDDLLDCVDGAGMTFGDQLGARDSVQTFEVGVAGVEDVG